MIYSFLQISSFLRQSQRADRENNEFYAENIMFSAFFLKNLKIFFFLLLKQGVCDIIGEEKSFFGMAVNA